MASTKSQRVIVHKKITEARVPIISALCHPNVSSFDAGLSETFKAYIEITKPSMSVAKCAVSVKMAIDPEIIPPAS